MVHTASMSTVFDPPTDEAAARGGRLVTADGRALPLVGAHLAADAQGGLARVVLTQRFENPYETPLHVRYLLPLPADGAVSGFAFTIDGERVVGEVQTTRAARETYEAALVAGRTAALVAQARTSLFEQSVGNIPPGAAVEAEIVVDQPLVWVDAGQWEWRFPTVVGPRYMGAPGRVPDARSVTVPVSDAPLRARAGLELSIRDALAEGGAPASPSHPVWSRTRRGATVVALADEAGARLDRDVVVRWPVAALAPGASLDVVRPATGDGDAFGRLTLVPPAPAAAITPVARDLVVLLDVSGSMGGEPLAQAVRVVSALVDTLEARDRLELVAFDTSARAFRPAPVPGTAANRAAALAWLRGLRAGGGTEMHAAVQAALSTLRDEAQRQVVLVTDGYIGFEAEIVAEVKANLPTSCRLHTVGVGSSVNRSLTQAAARAGAGQEVLIQPGEDPERAARRLVAHTDRPVVTDLRLEGDAVLDWAPRRLPDLFAGAPAQVSLRLSGAGGEVFVVGTTADGPLRQRLSFPRLERGAGAGQVAARYAREQVEDLEAHLAGGADRDEIDATIERLGLDFQISTRKTSWVAVSARARVDPRDRATSVEQPHEAPAFVDLEGLGLRPAAPAAFGGAAAQASASLGAPPLGRARAKKAKGEVSFDLKASLDLEDDEDEVLAELEAFEPKMLLREPEGPGDADAAEEGGDDAFADATRADEPTGPDERTGATGQGERGGSPEPEVPARPRARFTTTGEWAAPSADEADGARPAMPGLVPAASAEAPAKARGDTKQRRLARWAVLLAILAVLAALVWWWAA